MKVIETRENMLKIIRSVHAGDLILEEYTELICDRLMEAGAFVPPVNIGGEVFAALPPLFDEEADIDTWEVRGYGVDPHGDIYLIDEYDEEYYVGTNHCKLTLEEAEEELKKYASEG